MTEENPNYKLSHLSSKSSINIDFQDLSYNVPQGSTESKLILNNVSGKFKSGELTAVLGPSGSGKTTLLNLLAGYKFQKTTGTILINGESWKERKFRKISRYIMQENWVQPLLSVKESMMVAADLKLGRNVEKTIKLNMILEILTLLRLSAVKNTHTEELSGGERKRLFIALELISNPSVLFLDEPTTGLDEGAAYQCIILLKQLAETGRTIICSIHAPSARLFSCFHNSYFISSGQCVYQGGGSHLVSYLSQIEAPCPVQFNPADFIVELCSGDCKDLEEKMISVIKNGKNFYVDETFLPIENSQNKLFEEDRSDPENMFWYEFKTLLLRMWLIKWRNKRYLLLKVVCSLILGVLIGALYLNFAKDATKTYFNYTFFASCITFFLYIPIMPLLLQFPLDMKYLKREYFNGWYDLKSFFSALTVSTIPDQLIFVSLFLTTIYILTGQPLETQRILGFYGILLLVQTITEGYAMIIGCSMNVTNSLCFGIILLTPSMVTASFGPGEEYNEISLFTKILIRSSYIRYGFEGLMVVMLSGRKVKCPEDVDFCMFSNQDYFLKRMAMDQVSVWVDFLVLFVILIFMKSVSYYFLKQRLRPNKFFKILKSHIKIKISN